MADAHTKQHDYHLVDPSPWPAIGATSAFILAVGLIAWMHHIFAGAWIVFGLGALFTCVQAYEYMHAHFAFSGNVYGATFFMATGFHGFHVLVGTVFLLVCLFRAYAGHFTPTQHLGFEFAAWYWHFVDVVWLFLFASIYIWGSA